MQSQVLHPENISGASFKQLKKPGTFFEMLKKQQSPPNFSLVTMFVLGIPSWDL